MTETPAVDAQLLRRTQSTGDIPTRQSTQSSRARGSASNSRLGRSAHRTTVPSTSNTAPSPNAATPWLRQAGQSSPQESGTQHPDSPGELSLYEKLKRFLGLGSNASKTRKALVSFVLTLSYSFLQVVTIITVSSVASVTPSPQNHSINQINACGRPLVVWNSIWIVRLILATGLSYWHFVRIRAATRQGDSESTARPGTSQVSRSEDTNQRNRERISRSSPGPTLPSSSESTEPTLPYNHIYARLSLFTSMFSLAWFLTAHILEYTTIQTCRLSAPLVWWLTFAILCTMYFVVLEVVFFGFLVFMVLPLIMLLYSVILLCLGRHPLQNPHYIKPEIGKLPKSIVDRIPLVIYIPPPPDDATQPISLPKPVHTYPPRPPTSLRRKRFAFLPRRRQKDATVENQVEDKGAKAPMSTEATEEETWEDTWEHSQYPFVRLDGNRAACAICLMDFEEPRRQTAVKDGDSQRKRQPVPTAQPPRAQEEEIPVERITEEERDAIPRLQDAGGGPQPLRLLACGHVFHKTCIDPWLIDVSGRCPVCQRPVEIDDVEAKKTKRRR
ncbi:hypothetical protein EDC04DRAFT_2558531 [Pisolithus marmoratus]|nr:hypothetical protein EDC04DRAFT_2558531 [Pisolithus marmoratus]